LAQAFGPVCVCLRMFTITYPIMNFTAAPWESASSLMSSIALVAVALYMVFLFAFPFMAKQEEPIVEDKAPTVENLNKVTEDGEVSTDEGETSESDCESSECETESAPSTPARRGARVFFNEDANETTIIPSCLDMNEDTSMVDMSSIWKTTSFTNTPTEEKKVFSAPPGLEAPKYSANLLLACRPRAPPGLAPVSALNYRTETRPVCDAASWGLQEKKETKGTIFSSYHKKQERVQQKETAKARADDEAAARRVSRPAAPWKRQTTSAQWRL